MRSLSKHDSHSDNTTVKDLFQLFACSEKSLFPCSKCLMLFTKLLFFYGPELSERMKVTGLQHRFLLIWLVNIQTFELMLLVFFKKSKDFSRSPQTVFTL